MSEESHYNAVNIFRDIKKETQTEDIVAAILTLSQTLRYVDVSLEVSDSGFPERLGKDIADAIEDVTKEGAIQVNVGGEIGSIVRGMMDVSSGEGAKPKPKPAPKKTKRK